MSARTVCARFSAASPICIYRKGTYGLAAMQCYVLPVYGNGILPRRLYGYGFVLRYSNSDIAAVCGYLLLYPLGIYKADRSRFSGWGARLQFQCNRSVQRIGVCYAEGCVSVRGRNFGKAVFRP